MAAPHVTGLIARYVALHGRDANGDGKLDERDVYAIRQAIVDAAEPQAAWRADGATAVPDGLRVGLASVPGRRSPPPPDLAARPPARAPAPPPDLVYRPGSGNLVPGPGPGVAGVSVVAIVAPAERLREGERSGVLVGVRNKSARPASFEVLLVDCFSGTGLGRKRVASLAAGASATLVYPCDPASFDPRHELRAVVLATSKPPPPIASLSFTH
jgi:hypothetical protein